MRRLSDMYFGTAQTTQKGYEHYPCAKDDHESNLTHGIHLEIWHSDWRKDKQEDIDDHADAGYRDCEPGLAGTATRNQRFHPGFVASWTCKDELRHSNPKIECCSQWSTDIISLDALWLSYLQHDCSTQRQSGSLHADLTLLHPLQDTSTMQKNMRIHVACLDRYVPLLERHWMSSQCIRGIPSAHGG